MEALEKVSFTKASASAPNHEMGHWKGRVAELWLDCRSARRSCRDLLPLATSTACQKMRCQRHVSPFGTSIVDRNVGNPPVNRRTEMRLRLEYNIRR